MMVHTPLPILLLLLSSTRLSTAYPSPGLTLLPKDKCTYAGQLVCASATTFAICDVSLTGIIQPLALGDTRCGDFAGGNVVPAAAATTAPSASHPAASPYVSSTIPASSQRNLGFMKTIELMVATASPPPPARQPGGPTSSSMPKSPPKQSTPATSSATPAPHFAQGPGLEVVPTTLPHGGAASGRV
ncbi:hypothetical protein AYL99_09707 [Fonsecaea erecta]|uniref:Uncharacterized protein n=1 Tax=Fonsecaea erecta TaxID=1367422 RepID=A0A178Z9R9_9EURO|nr:hypothetical protein AYL99_09707 [Fonsecaea erecta]OAP56528.1 hypothetical protein AYL99_09707 [Fonsecaea erecta]